MRILIGKGGRRDDIPVATHDHGIDAQGYFLDEENGYNDLVEHLSVFKMDPVGSSSPKPFEAWTN